MPIPTSTTHSAANSTRNGPYTDQFSVDIVNELLKQIDGVQKNDRTVFVLAATIAMTESVRKPGSID
jgi:SpoVK/Ycf46/Vps4 family AAA+-type ATPase